MYVCNGTSIAVWLTGTTAGNSATLRSADGRFVAQVSVTPRRAGGVLSIPGGSEHRFVAPSVVRTSGLFDVTIGQTGVVRGRVDDRRDVDRPGRHRRHAAREGHGRTRPRAQVARR